MKHTYRVQFNGFALLGQSAKNEGKTLYHRLCRDDPCWQEAEYIGLQLPIFPMCGSEFNQGLRIQKVPN